MRGKFKFKYDKKEINLHFNTQCIAEFCEFHNDMKLSEFLELLSDSLKIRQLASLMLFASKAAEENDYELKDAYAWIDSLGGINGEKLVKEMIPKIIEGISPKTEADSKNAESR